MKVIFLSRHGQAEINPRKSALSDPRRASKSLGGSGFADAQTHFHEKENEIPLR